MAPESRHGAMPDDFSELWLAETLRLRESQWGPLEDAAEVRKVRAQGGDFETRVLARARLIAQREGMAQSMSRWRSLARLTLLLFCLMALLLGAAAAAGALGPGGAVNLAPALTALLGLNTLAFLLWLGSFGVQGGAAGSMLADAWLKLTRKLARGPDAALLPRALLGLLSRHRMQRWAAGLLSHGFWALALGAALITMLGMLVTRRYTFHWETTLLSPDTFVLLVQGLGWLPSLIGFPGPSEEVIRSSSGLVALPESAQAAWSLWLVGTVFTYGLLPRLAALAISVMVLRRRRRTLRLEAFLPGVAELHDRLMPASETTGIDLPAPALQSATLATPHDAPATDRLRGLMGLELPRELLWESGCLPDNVSDFGMIDGREPRRRLLENFQQHMPMRLVVCCDARQTPDRGTVAFLAELAGSVRDIRLLLLPEDAASTRQEQWHQFLLRAGFTPMHFCRGWDAAMHWLATEGDRSGKEAG